jgi:hypothetical protein
MSLQLYRTEFKRNSLKSLEDLMRTPIRHYMVAHNMHATDSH